jgi:hypothetical protein
MEAQTKAQKNAHEAAATAIVNILFLQAITIP